MCQKIYMPNRGELTSANEVIRNCYVLIRVRFGTRNVCEGYGKGPHILAHSAGQETTRDMQLSSYREYFLFTTLQGMVTHGYTSVKSN